MIVIQLLANGVLQQVVEPIAYGVALGIHPLAVLVVTIAGGSLVGAILLLGGVAGGLKQLSSLVFFLALTALS